MGCSLSKIMKVSVLWLHHHSDIVIINKEATGKRSVESLESLSKNKITKTDR